MIRKREWGLIPQDTNPKALPHDGEIDTRTELYVQIDVLGRVWYSDAEIDTVGLGRGGSAKICIGGNESKWHQGL